MIKFIRPLAVLFAAVSPCLAVTNNVGLPRFPSVSPDGKQIVFAWRGDLWRVPTSGGEATRLTVNPQDDNYSTWSPDGRQIAFTSERVGGGNLFTMNADGTDVHQVSQTDRYMTILGWNDRDGLVTHARMEQDWFPSLRSYGQPLQGGEPVRLFDAFGSYPAVSPDGSKILFTRGTTSWSRRGYRGSDNRELWLYDRNGKTYTRLTTWNGNDGRAKWADNSTFVYASDREDGTVNLYLQRLGQQESQARRVTKNNGVDVEDFDIARDGKTLVYASWDRLYHLDLSNLNTEAQPIDIAAEDDVSSRIQYRTIDRSVGQAAMSPDGKTMAVISFGQVYVRGTEPRSATRRVSPTFAHAKDLAWSPDGLTLYFTSDAGGIDAIYAATVTLSRSDVKRELEPTTRPGTTRMVRRVRVVEQQGDSNPTVQPTTDTTDNSDDATSQPTTRRTPDDAAALRWSDALQFDVKPLISSDQPNTNVDPSPDGRSLAFERGQGQLWIYDLASGTERRLVDGWSGSLHWRWSPDSQHIAYSSEDANNNADIFIVPADGSRAPVNITRHPDNDTSPRWSADGKILAFLSERNDNEADVYTVILDRDVAALTGTDLDAYYKDAADKAKRRQRPTHRATTRPATAPSTESTTSPTTEPTTAPTTSATTTPATRASRETLDLDDAYLRVRRMTTLPGAEGDLEILPAGDKLVFTARSGGSTPALATAAAAGMGGRATFILERGESSEPRRLATAVNIQGLNFDGDRAVVVDSGRAAALNLATGALEYSDVTDRLAVDVDQFNALKLDEASRILGQIYYDPTMNGLDWPVVTKRYVDLLRGTRMPGEFDHVANKLLGELNGSHLGIRAPDMPNPDAVIDGRLGIEWTRLADGYEVKRVYENGPAYEGLMRLRVGDVITGIEGTPLTPTDTLEGRLANRVGKETLVTVRRDGKTVNLLVNPITFEAEANLAYDQWRKDTAERVNQLSHGRLGYIHIRGMNQQSLDVFERDLFAAADGKDGLLIDVRNNGGGSTTDLLLGSIMYSRHAYTMPRGYTGSTNNYPQDRLYIQRYNQPMDLLCNEKSFSNAEIFSHAFKTLKRGTLVGQQTAGGVISTGATALLDGTSVRLPNRGWYTLDGTNMELHGAMPDLVVIQTPEDEAAENDEQLQAAVNDLLKRLPAK